MASKTPPQPPPRVRGAPMTAEAITRVQSTTATSPLGWDRDDGYTDDDEAVRQDIFERLQQYYLVYESERVQQGIGHIVDWTMVNGIEELDQRLKVKYGETLTEFEERTAKEKAAAARGGGGGTPAAAESFMGRSGGGSFYGSPGAPPSPTPRPIAPAPPPGLSSPADMPRPVPSAAAAVASRTTVRDRLLAFYARCEPDRLKKGVDDLVDYVARKGLPALNDKLMKKFGITLDEFEAGKEPQAPRPQPSPMHGGIAQQPSSLAPAARVSMRSLLRRSFRARHSEVPPGQLPPFVRPLLELFYSKYDQTKINSGGVNAIYKWAEKHGLRALNQQLKTKYLEDLTEFADRMGQLRDDLEEFYAVHDPSKLANGGVDAILRWGVRNGRAAINRQLREKYQADLEEKDPARGLNTEPDF